MEFKVRPESWEDCLELWYEIRTYVVANQNEHDDVAYLMADRVMLSKLRHELDLRQGVKSVER